MACFETILFLRSSTLVTGVHEVLPKVGRMEERLGGDAADVQASAAELRIFFDNRGLQAVLAGANCGRISAWTAADDDQIVVLSSGGRRTGPVPERAIADRMHGLEIRIGLASELRQRRWIGWRLGKGQLKATADGCRAPGDRHAIEKNLP